MAVVQDLPEDLLYLIAGQLSPQDLCALREACKDMSVKTFNVFKRVCFEDLGVTFTKERINELIQISKDNSFGPEVHKLVICIASPSDDSPIADVDVLVEALNNLRNCKTLTLTDGSAHWGPKQSEGPEELDNKSQRLPAVRNLVDKELFRDVLRAALTAVETSEIPVTELGIHSERLGSSSSLFDSIPETVINSSSQSGLRSVTTIQLSVPRPSNPPAIHMPSNWPDKCRRFLGVFSGVSHLSLEFNRIDVGRDAIMSLQIALSSLRLQKLELGSLNFEENELSELLFSHRQTLEEITLRRIGTKTHIDDWSAMLNNMRQLPHIRSVNLIGCTHCQFSDANQWWVDAPIGDYEINDQEDFEEAIVELGFLEQMDRGDPRY